MTAWWLIWLFQGAILTLMASATVRLGSRLNAATRYGIWWSTLALTAAAGVATFPVENASPGTSGSGGSDYLLVVPSAPRMLVAVLMGIWVAIVVVKLVRLVAAVHSVHALRDSCAPMPAAIEAQLPLWSEARHRGRRARLMICDGVPGATVLGFFDPYIALPRLLIDDLTRQELDLVILHERAHVQRRDDWLKLAQELLLAPLWMHPAAMFVSRQLGREREMACDEWVVGRTAQPTTYARCLTRAAEIQRRGRRIVPQPLLGQTLLKQIELAGRIDRLLGARGPARRNLSTLALSTVACTMLATATVVGTVPLIAELGDVVIPAVSTPASRFNAGLSRVLPRPAGVAQSLRLARSPASRRTLPAAAATRSAPPAPGERERHSTAPVELYAADAEPVVLTSKTFEWLHSIAPTPATARVVAPMTPWQKTSNASVRFAEGLTRAGTSLARRF